MGRRCAWCGTSLPIHPAVWSPGSDAICRLCFDELEGALAPSELPSGPDPRDGEPTAIG